MARRRASDDRPPGAPEWIVTFSDMVTLLLTFFVMLQSMAKIRVEKHKFEMGLNSIQQAFASFGFSSTLKPTITNFEHPQPQYAVEEGDEADEQEENRAFDAQTEMLRRLMWDIENMAKITPSPIAGVNRMFMPTDIHFAPSRIDLNDETKAFLSKYCQQLSANYVGQEATIYVLGIAASEAGTRQQWFLSAQRAQAVAEFIKNQQPPDTKWYIYSWGAGPGGDWIGPNGLVSSKTEITIVVLTNNQ